MIGIVSPGVIPILFGFAPVFKVKHSLGVGSGHKLGFGPLQYVGVTMVNVSALEFVKAVLSGTSI
jgi:hypothetical protein